MADELLLSVAEAARRLGVSRSTLYNKLRQGTICSLTIGSLRRIPVADLQEYIQKLRDEAAARGGY
jgi:excisionase family DNA binding protein